jgi:cytochrome c-type biogenesis protein
MSTKTLIGILLAGTIGMIVFLFVQLSGRPHKISVGAKTAAACDRRSADSCLPDVKYVDTTGKTYSAEGLLGKVVVVNFWATWCNPCQKEIPDLSKLYDKYKANNVLILGILTDDPPDSTLLNFQSDYEMTYPVVRSNSDIITAFNYPQALPTTFIFDKSGRRAGSPIVGSIRFDALSAQIAELVAQ